MIQPDYFNESYFDIEFVARNQNLKRIGKDKYQGDCPACGYKNAFSLSLSRDGKPLAYCHVNQCEMRPFLRSIYNRDSEFHSVFHSQPLQRYATAKTAGNHVETEIIPYHEWDRCTGNDPVTKYLRGRGITIDIPPTIGYQKLRNDETKEMHHTMAGFIMRVGQRDPIAKHITYIKADGSGKADVPIQKKIFCSFHGGAVMLAPPAYEMAVSEGIESGLSFQQGAGIPTWAALSSGNIPNLILPPKPMASKVVIAADYDKAGLDAARSAQARWEAEGRDVEIAKPDKPDTDFNDMLIEELEEVKKRNT